MKTKWALLDAPSVSTQLIGCRPARLSGKPSRHKLDRGVRVLCPRAAATLTPASVVTSRPQIKHLETQLGPLGQSLVQQVEVRSPGCSNGLAASPEFEAGFLYILVAANFYRQGRR